MAEKTESREVFKVLVSFLQKATSLRSERTLPNELGILTNLVCDSKIVKAVNLVRIYNDARCDIDRILWDIWARANVEKPGNNPSADQVDEAIERLTGLDGIGEVLDSLCRSLGYVPVAETMATLEAIRATPQTDDL